MIHELKCWPEWFDAVTTGNKTFEVRKNDRGYAVGDTLRLKEWNPKTERYTDFWIERVIVYLFPLSALNIAPGYVVLGIEEPSDRSAPGEGNG